MRRAPFVLILFFLILMMAGICLGEPDRVLQLSTQVCLACIGIG